ncbi:hypothetical protein QAD02_008233 [Eretmocerus hayati]|uniref:Uncharacterized protein n=1 Tax=Eretmocerus hayati TaxID=131215 RepID=A0ACC2N6Q6_9HYME|nr:hypothetical protein QAD02_008233 [Eretmocerus hayati]
MDEETENLLKSWGFEKYITKFEDEEIDVEALRALTLPMLKDLILTVGGRSKFFKCLSEHFTQDVADYLKRVVDGKSLFSTYEKRSFNKADRSKLCEIIIKNQLDGDPNERIPQARLKELSLQIEVVFPEEKADGVRTSMSQSGPTPIVAIEDVSDDLEILQLFAGLFDPFPINGQGEKIFWRPSKVEIVDGFILHVKTISDVVFAVKGMREKLIAAKKTLQPIPIVVDSGEDGNRMCYVQIEDFKYSASSVQKSVYLCFKSYHALHAEYPAQSAHPWLLLQKGVYKLNTA